MFEKILIANRGEIACRIVKTAKKMGIQTVAVYSTPDQSSLHVLHADEAYWIGHAPSTESYLNQDNIIKAALSAGVDAIHPGYGFLSENPDFAKKCKASGITFIGPSSESMDLMASKKRAKQLLESTDVPLTPGYHGDDQKDTTLLDEAKKIGFPVLLKAAAGGGGKGMRAVKDESEFSNALSAARRESLSSFGDDTMVIEKLVENPRHVEVQLMADNHGHVIHLFDRDCSIQRRHQKIIEEAPAPNLSDKLRDEMSQAAVLVAQTINYSGAGTVEFLVDEEQFYFMEMNTRLQVEHPVTEMITGIDLVELQIRVAANETLPIKQSDIKACGHAIECRIYAEDPTRQFIPSTGQISYFKTPSQEGIRIDTHMAQGAEISMFYDPMIAKLIGFGQNRQEATQRLEKALQDFCIAGVKTNLSFLKTIIAHPHFKKEKLSTAFLNDFDYNRLKPEPKPALFIAGCIDYWTHQQTLKNTLLKEAFGWSSFQHRQWRMRFSIDDEMFDVDITALTPNTLKISIDDELKLFELAHFNNGLFLTCDGVKSSISYHIQDHTISLFGKQGPVTIHKLSASEQYANEHLEPHLKAPMPAMVVSVLQEVGDNVQKGQSIMILEAMKMEHTITAPFDGTIKNIHFKPGEQVKEGVELLEMNTI